MSGPQRILALVGALIASSIALVIWWGLPAGVLLPLGAVGVVFLLSVALAGLLFGLATIGIRSGAAPGGAPAADGQARPAGADEWIRGHRRYLYGGWAVIGASVVVALVLGPDFHYIRGIAPLPRIWAILFFLSLWGWVALRFIALWIWAWVVMALAPVCLAYPIWYNLDAWWLVPLLWAVAGLSALTVVVVVAWELRRRRKEGGEPVARSAPGL